MNPFRWFEIGVSMIAGLLTITVFSLLIVFPERSVFFAVAGVWLAMLIVFLRRLVRRHLLRGEIGILIVATTLSCMATIGLVEWRPLQAFLILFAGVLMSFLISLGIGEREEAVFEYKRVRRFFMMVWVFNAFAFGTMLFAIGIFFPAAPMWLLIALGGIGYAACAHMIWHMYIEMPMRERMPWDILCAVIMMDLLWAMQLLPFGYLASGLLATWLWYVFQLLARFHFGPKGIVWRHQRWFLLTNAALYAAALLFFVRWV